MIRTRTTGADGREHIALGLSRGNVNRLMAGQPILVTGESIDCPAIGTICVFFGETEAVMEEDLRGAGLISQRTVVRDLT